MHGREIFVLPSEDHLAGTSGIQRRAEGQTNIHSGMLATVETVPQSVLVHFALRVPISNILAMLGVDTGISATPDPARSPAQLSQRIPVRFRRLRMMLGRSYGLSGIFYAC